jgi:hypothetical protein
LIVDRGAGPAGVIGVECGAFSDGPHQGEVELGLVDIAQVVGHKPHAVGVAADVGIEEVEMEEGRGDKGAVAAGVDHDVGGAVAVLVHASDLVVSVRADSGDVDRGVIGSVDEEVGVPTLRGICIPSGELGVAEDAWGREA